MTKEVLHCLTFCLFIELFLLIVNLKMATNSFWVGTMTSSCVPSAEISQPSMSKSTCNTHYTCIHVCIVGNSVCGKNIDGSVIIITSLHKKISKKKSS